MITEMTLKVWSQEAQQMSPYFSNLFPPSPYYRFLRILARELKPQLSVVLGVCGGGCCLHLSLGHLEGKVIGIDLIADHPEQINYIRGQCANFIFYQGDSITSAPEIHEMFGKVGILFVDTIHTFKQTIDELEAWRPYLADEFVVCFDDLRRAEMGGFWSQLNDNKLRLDDLHPIQEGGFGVIWKNA